jgi:acetyltransferase-like isoleucine patch superfamily enzyme
LIEPFCFISDSVKLGNDVILAPHCVLAAARHNFSDLSKPINKQGSKTLPIEIGNNAWLGAHVVVIGPSKIGSDSIIGAGAIIKGEIPEKSIVRTEPKMNIEKRRSLAK